MRLTTLVFRAALGLYPRSFRIRYQDELLHDLGERSRLLAEEEGSMGVLLFRLASILAVVPSALRVRMDQRRQRKAMKAREVSTADVGPRDPTSLRQPLGKEWIPIVFGDLWRDFRFSLRSLLRSPVFTVAAVVTLALGIGLNAATFSVVNGLILRPLNGAEEPEELVQIYRQWAGIEYGSVSIPHYQSLRDDTEEIFENVASWYFAPMSVTSGDQTERLLGLLVSANFFQTYGVNPAVGRLFLPGIEDRDPGAHQVVILGHSYWQARFGGDPDVVGTTMTLNGRPFEIVGVAQESFGGPMSLVDAELYVPLMMQMEIQPGANLIESRGNNMMNAVGRLRDDASLQKAQEFLDAHLLRLREEYPDHYDDQLGTTLILQNEAGIHPMFRNAQVGMSVVMMAVVGLLLLIACVNVANLFLVRARERRREMGIRLSIGAGRRRIIQQLLTEATVFSLVAGAAGLAVSRLAMGALARFRPPVDGPFVMDMPLDGKVLLFTLGISLAAGMLFGLAPALQAANPETMSAIKGESADGPGRSRASSALVVLQMALSILLLISSGLFIRSLQGATNIDPGFDDPANLVTASLDPGLLGYEEARAREFFDNLLERIQGLPQVSEVGMVSYLPLGFGSSDRGVAIPGYEFAEGERNSLHYSFVTEGYLEAMGIGLVEGRTFTRADDAKGQPVIIINKRFADRFWPGESAVGKIVETAGAAREVVGVVETGKVSSLGEEPKEFMYLPHRDRFEFAMTLVARTRGSAGEAMGDIRRVVREMDPNMPVYDVRTMEDHMGIALLPARLGGEVLGAFGLLGLLLAAVGVYGVMAYSVAQRTRELGIRVAIGAEQSAVLGLVLREGMKLAVFGTILGLLGAAGAAQLIQGFLYNTRALDPVAFLGVPAVLLTVAALAVYLPARKAAAVDPMKALKVE